MAEKVGEIYFDVVLDTGRMVSGQREVQKNLDKTTGSLDDFNGKLNSVVGAIKLYAAAMTLVKSATMADDVRLLSARVQVAAGSFESGAAAMAALQRISAQTQTSLEANATVFARLNQSLIQMGGTQADTLRLTDLLGKAIKISGASAAESASAMQQFGQALGSGKLAGDELRSLLENAPYLMQQLADGLEVPIGALRTMGEAGQLTSDVVVNALGKAAEKINRDFATFPQTVASAMTVMQDAAARANAKFDELTGTSAALTGTAQGLGTVLDELASQFGAANTEAGTLGRNEAVKSWADKTKLALSYVIDAADLVWQTISVLGRNVAFVVNGVGTEIGGIAAQAAAVARLDFAGAQAIGEAMKADAAKRRKELDAADAASLGKAKLAGAKMREAWEQGAAGAGRGVVNPTLPGGTIKPAAAPDTKKTGGTKASSETFDAAGYLAGLDAQAADAMTRIGIVEDEALRKAQDLLSEKKLSQQEYNDAVTLIEAKAAQDRLDIQLKEGEDALAARYEQMAREKKADDEIMKGQTFAVDSINGANPITKLEAELAEKTAKLAEYAALDQENAQLYADAKVALEQQTADKIREIREKEEKDRLAKQSKQLQDYGNLFGSMAGLIQTFGGKQNAAYKAMFAASKAFAIADAIINIQAGIAKAANGVFPQNLGAMATVAAQTAGIVSTISSTEYGGGRQYGGPVSAGSMYRINETGKPEMFTASNGSQYMLPTKSGSVTPADQVGQSSVVINQSFTFGDGVNRSELMQYGESIKQQTLAAVYQGRTRGGAYE